MTALKKPLTKKEEEKHAELSQKQIEFELMVKSLAKDFINIHVDKIDQAIIQSLNLLGEYCMADRITIYLYNWKEGIVSLQNEWVREERFRVKGEFKKFPLSLMMPEILEKHKNNLPYVGNIKNDKPEMRNYYTDLKKTGAQITTSIPLMINNMAIGSCVLSKIENSDEWSQPSLAIISLFCEMLSNIFHRIQYENEILEKNETMTLVLNSASDGIGMLDKGGIILSINSQLASRFGKDPKDVIGLHLKNLIPIAEYSDLYEQILIKVNKVFESNQPIQFEVSRDGFWFSNRVYPVLKEGAVIAATLFSSDITDRIKALEETRKNAEYEAKLKIQTDFFTNMSHEFKTPLTIILLQLQLMKSYTSNKDKVDDSINSLMQNAYRLTRLVGNLLDISKLDAGHLKIDMHYIDIIPLTREITNSISSYALSKSINLTFETKLLGYFMAVDIDKTERIILNLLSNAIKFSQNGGSINVTVKGRQNSILIVVSDNGIGIQEDKLEFIFDRFAQVDTSLTRKTEGSGIGLSLTKSLVELLKGTIWVKSKPGKGSKFYVELPTLKIEENQRSMQVDEYGLVQKVKIEFSDIYY